MFARTLLTALIAICVSSWSVCSGQANEAGAAQEADAAIKGVEVSDFDTVSLNVQDADLAQVLQLLSIQGQRNIVPSPAVDGKVTANLYDVTFEQALQAILQQNGAGYVEKGKFIYVYTQDELRKIQQAERQVTHKVYRLNYITAADASTFVTPLLSSAGSIAVSGEAPPGFQPSLSDNGANSFAHSDTLVVRDYEENIKAIRKVLDQIDTRPKQVLVEATILKADVTDATAFGVDFSILTNVALDAFTNPFSAVDELVDGSQTSSSGIGAIESTGGSIIDQSSVRVGVVTNNVAAFVTALDSVTDTTIVANPKILALNRQKADVLVGEKIGYLSTTATATATTQTVEFLDVGTQLTVRPFVSDEGYIRLELKPQISSSRIRDVTPDSSGAAVTIPDEITQELTTNVMVRDGQTIVLGGLFKEETQISRSQIPYLGDIPVAGAAFKGRDDQTSRSEVIFLITPHIVRDKSLAAAGDAVAEGAEMIRLGAREGLLPWSRTKMTAAHLRDALKALENNDTDTALWEVDMALFLDPTKPEALRLREKLTGKRAYWPGSSLLDDAVNLMVERTTGEPVQRARPMVPDPRPSQPVSNDEPIGMLNQPADDAPAPATKAKPEPAAAPDHAADAGAVDQAEREVEAQLEPVAEAPETQPVRMEPDTQPVQPLDLESEPEPAASNPAPPSSETAEAPNANTAAPNDAAESGEAPQADAQAQSEAAPNDADAQADAATSDEADAEASLPWGASEPIVRSDEETSAEGDGNSPVDNTQVQAEAKAAEIEVEQISAPNTEWSGVLNEAVREHFGGRDPNLDSDATTHVEPESPSEPY